MSKRGRSVREVAADVELSLRQKRTHRTVATTPSALHEKRDFLSANSRNNLGSKQQLTSESRPKTECRSDRISREVKRLTTHMPQDVIAPKSSRKERSAKTRARLSRISKQDCSDFVSSAVDPLGLEAESEEASDSDKSPEVGSFKENAKTIHTKTSLSEKLPLKRNLEAASPRRTRGKSVSNLAAQNVALSSVIFAPLTPLLPANDQTQPKRPCSLRAEMRQKRTVIKRTSKNVLVESRELQNPENLRTAGGVGKADDAPKQKQRIFRDPDFLSPLDSSDSEEEYGTESSENSLSDDILNNDSVVKIKRRYTKRQPPKISHHDSRHHNAQTVDSSNADRSSRLGPGISVANSRTEVISPQTFTVTSTEVVSSTTILKSARKTRIRPKIPSHESVTRRTRSRQPETEETGFSPKKSRQKPPSGPGFEPTPQTLRELRRRIQTSVLPDSLPCREEEAARIQSFLEGNIDRNASACMYISGVPGTGKTATVRQVIKCLENRENGPHFTFVDINAMKLAEPYQIFVEIYRTLFRGKKVAPALASKALTKFFDGTERKRNMMRYTVLLIDEIDLLWTRKQQVLYQILDWPGASPDARLTILAIANTMDLPERALSLRVSSRLGMVRLFFNSYTHQELGQIIHSRLQGLRMVKSNAVELVARKIASISGDARRALELCRRALEVAERARRSELTLTDIQTAVTEMQAMPHMMAVRFCSTSEKLVLRGIMAENRRTGVEDTSLQRILGHVKKLHHQEGLQPPSLTSVCALVDRLAAQRLVVANGRRLGRKLRLNLDLDDVKMQLDECKTG